MVQFYDRPVHMGWYNFRTGRSIWDGTILGPAGPYGMVQCYDWPVNIGWYNLTTGRCIWDGATL